MESAVSAKGRATIPKAIRDHLGLKPGDRVRFFIDRDGSVAILPVLPVTSLKGLVGKPSGPATTEEMDEAIGTAATG